MYLRDFQIVLRAHDKQTYLRLRACWDPIELEIRRAIPSRFDFGGVGKIVLELGPETRPRPQYRAALNVGLYHYPEFDSLSHLERPAHQRWMETLDIVGACMTDLSMQFSAPIDWLTDSISRLRRNAPGDSSEPNGPPPSV